VISGVTLLAICAVVYGVTAAWVFRRLTDARRVSAAINQILAHVMEFRLFIDEPSLVWRAQKAALRANMALLRAVAIPCLVMAGLLALAWGPMDRRFGHGPLRIGEVTVMTARTDSAPAIDGLVVETPGVRMARTGEVSWRVRVVRTFVSNLPTGIEVRYPRSRWWEVWFFAISSLSALVLGKTM
jgi:hypothetical protein